MEVVENFKEQLKADAEIPQLQIVSIAKREEELFLP